MKYRICFYFVLIFHTLINSQSDSKSSEIINFSNKVDKSKINSIDFNSADLFKGKLNLKFNLYTIKIGDLEFPVELSYDTGGIKLDQEASNVGLGWILESDGEIIKKINDIEDNVLSQNSAAQFIEAPYTIGYNFNKTLGSKEKLGKTLSTFDLAPDTFYLKTGKFSTKFYVESTAINFPPYYYNSSTKTYTDVTTLTSIDKPLKYFLKFYDSSNLDYKFETSIGDYNDYNVQPYVFPNSVLYSGNSDYISLCNSFAFPHLEYQSFKLKDNVGNSYYFKDKNLEQYSKNVLCRNSYGNVGPNYANVCFFPLYVSSWKINEIEDTKTNKILFEYEQYSDNIGKNVFNDGGLSYCFDEKRFILNNRIKKISTRNVIVEFFYDILREDLLHEKALTSITVKDFKNNLVKKINFEYGYFQSKENCQESRCKRLKLLSFTEFYLSGKELKTSFEYDETPMASKGSFEKDFMGFYNNNGVLSPTIENFQTIPVTSPKLYKYGSFGKYSTLPFKLTNVIPELVYSGYSIEPNANSSASSLIKITYPTKGFLKIEYENNVFNYKGENITGGGNRIKTQKLYEYNGKLLKNISYEYLENNSINNSSGILNDAPIFIQPFYLKGWDKTEQIFNEEFGQKSIGRDLSIGYSYVKEKFDNNSEIEYNFNNFSDPENPKRSIIENPYFTDYNNIAKFRFDNYYYNPRSFFYDEKVGKLIKKTVRDSNSIILNVTNYLYKDDIFSSAPLVSNYYDRNFAESLRIGQYLIIQSSSQLNKKNYQLSEVIYEDYIKGNNKLNFIKKYAYNINNNLISTLKTMPDNTIYEEKIQYSTEKKINELDVLNMFSVPLKNQIYKNGKLLSSDEILYGNINSFYLPISKIKNCIEDINKTSKTFNIKLYDNYGNILEYEDNYKNFVIIYGYNQTLPIAIIEGANYINIMNIFNLEFNNSSYLNLDIVKKSNVDIDEVSETNLINSLDVFRNNPSLKDFQITTFSHNPLIGITSKTLPSGVREIYKYDAANRLEKVVDSNGNILKEYKYNYKK